MCKINDLKLNKHYLIQKSYSSDLIEVSVRNAAKHCVFLRTYTPNNRLNPYYDEWVEKDEVIYKIIEELKGEGLRKIKKLRDEQTSS